MTRQYFIGSINRILYDYKYKLFVRRYHDLVFLAANPQKGEVVGWIQVANNGASLVGQLTNQSCILNGRCVVQCRFNRDT